MQKIMQVFNINLAHIQETRMIDGNIVEKAARKAVLELVEELYKKGYEVAHSLKYFDGIPTSLIVSSIVSDVSESRLIPNVKDDFYGIAETVGLPWFESGEFYLDISDIKEQIY